MPAVGMGFELTAALQEAKQLDQYFNKWINDSVTIGSNMSKALNAKVGGDITQYVQSLRDVQAIVKDMSGKDFITSPDPKKFEQIEKAFERIIAVSSQLSSLGVGLFNTDGIYATAKGVGEATTQFDKLSKSVQDLVSQYKLLDSSKKANVVKGMMAGETFADDKERSARKAQLEAMSKDALEAEAKNRKIRTEALLQAALEAEAIARKELNFAKMTQDEKAQYLRKKMNEILAEEQKQVNAIRKEYSDLYRNLGSTMSALGSYNARMSEGKTLSKADQDRYVALQDMEQKFRARMLEIETNHLQHVSDLRLKFALKDAQATADALKSVQYSPQEALKMAANARTGNAKEAAKQAVQSALMNVDESDVKTIEALNKAYIKLRAGIESLTKAQNNEKTLQPTIRNEYERTLKEMSTLEEAKRRLAATSAFKNGEPQAAKEMQDLVARYNDLEKRKQEIATQSGALIAEVERKHASDLAQTKIKEYEAAEKKKRELAKQYGTMSTADAEALINKNSNPANVRQAQKAVEDLSAAREKLNNQDANYEATLAKLNAEIAKHKDSIEKVTNAEAAAKKQRETHQGALAYSKQAKSVNDLRTAISALDAARNKEDITTKQGRRNYEELTKEMERQKKKYDELTKHVSNGGKNMSNTASQIKRAFASLFSIQQIRGYIKNLMEVRGELEMQHRSLQVLVKDVDKANELWDKTVALAVKSPFRVKDLVTYTKQLAAYNIETEKLYDTNKMLADISAGLGVDMNRLILAFGQVKAANFLRGTELRQFSEAGVNLLEELSERFTEMEGRAVSVGDVFERVSKRMVSFKDVEAVLQKITSKGGDFYQMQEKQAETLKGMMMNLKDSVDLMLNDIGISNDGVLKGAVSLAKEMVDNWRKIKPVIESAGIVLATYFGVKAIGKIIAAMETLWATMAANPVMAAIAGVAMLATVIWRCVANVDKLTASLNQVDIQITKQMQDSITQYRELAETVRDVTATEEEREQAMSEIQQQYDDILPQMYLEEQYIKNIADDYDAATNAMMNYYNSKAIQQKAERVETNFADELEGTDIPDLVESTKDLIEDMTSGLSDRQEEVLKGAAPGIINKFVDDIKSGELALPEYLEYNTNVEALMEELEKRLADYIKVDPKKLGFDAGFKEDVSDIYDTLLEYREAMESIQGLPFANEAEENAGKAFASNKKNVEAAKAALKEVINLMEEYSKIDKSEWDLKKMQDGYDAIIAKMPEEAQYYAKYIKPVFDTMKAEAEKGTFEFTSSLPDFEQIFLRSFTLNTGFLADQVGADQYKDLAETFNKGLKDAADKLDPSPLQEAVIDVFDAVAKETKGVDNDLFTEFIPDKKKSRGEIIKALMAKAEQFEETLKAWNKTIAEGVDVATAEAIHQVTQDAIDQMKLEIPALKEAASRLGYVEKSKGGSDNIMDERIRVVQEMNQAYHELNETLASGESIEGAFAKYKDAFGKAYKGTSLLPKGFANMTAEQFIEEFNFTTEEGMVAFFEELEGIAKKKSDKIKVELAKGEYVMEARVEDVQINHQQIIDRVQGIFDNYDLSKELKGMDVSPAIAEKLFGVQYTTLGQLKEGVIKEFSITSDVVNEELKNSVINWESIWKALTDDIGKDQAEELRKRLEDIGKIEDKEQKERFKKYVEYAKLSIGERAKVKLEELRKLKEIEETFKVNDTDDADTKAFKERMASRARANVKKESTSQMNKLDWEAFEKSDTFVRIFEDLEGASISMLNSAIGNLKKFREAWKDMPLEDMNKIINKINELEEALIKLKPGEMWSEGKTFVKDAYAKAKEDEGYFTSQKAKDQFAKGGKANFLKAVEEETVYQEEEKRKATEQIALLEVALRIKEGMATEEEKLLATDEKYKALLEYDAETLGNMLDTQKGIVDGADQVLIRNQDITKARQKQVKSLQRWGELSEEAVNSANDLFGAIDEIAVALGGDEDGPFAIFGQMSMDILAAIPNMIALIAQIMTAETAANGLGTAMNMALGIIGIIVIAVQLLAKIISAAVNYAEQVKENKIEVMTKQVEDLEKAYEKLAETAEKAWSIEQLQAYSKELDSVHKQAIDTQEAIVSMMADDKQVKAGIEAAEKLARGEELTNKERKALLDEEYQEYKEAADKVAEMREEHEAQKQKMLEDVGSVDDYRDATRDFVNAWVDAFQETGDGLSGLQENFREFFDNIIKEQATLKVVDKFLAPLYDNINTALNDYELTSEESKALREQAEKIAPDLSAALEEIWNQLGGSSGEASGELSALQKGIQGVTEETAQVIEALLNSMRFYVADSNTELKEQTKYLRDIYNLLVSLRSPMPNGSKVAGLGLKIVM